MKALIAVMAALGLMAGCGLRAQAPAGAPAGATGICKDGSYWTGTSKQGACRGHKGIQTWYADAGSGSGSGTGAGGASVAPRPTQVPSAAATKSVATAAAPQAAAGAAPAGATGVCKDGSYWTGTSKQGACRGHQGIQTWYADAGVKSMPAPTPAVKPTPAMPAPTPAASAPMARPAPSAAPSMPAAPATSRQGPAAAAAAKTAVPGGAPGMVWVNTDSNVYHCYGDTYYGKTKAGAYMTEADAKAKGARPARGNACSK